MPKPLQVGVAQNVVAEISCDREALEWIAYALPQGDGFTKDLHAALAEVDRAEEEEAADVAEFGRPALEILVGPDHTPYFNVYRDHGPTRA
jgi:hypothetical protein